MKVVLERYHGLGNDYVVFDPNKNELELTRERRPDFCEIFKRRKLCPEEEFQAVYRQRPGGSDLLK